MPKDVQTFRASPKLRALLRRAAALDDKTPSEWVRITVEREAKRRLEEAEREAARASLRAMLAELRKPGGMPEAEAEKFAVEVVREVRAARRKA